jgi:hypothetical protein
MGTRVAIPRRPLLRNDLIFPLLFLKIYRGVAQNSKFGSRTRIEKFYFIHVSEVQGGGE